MALICGSRLFGSGYVVLLGVAIQPRFVSVAIAGISVSCEVSTLFFGLRLSQARNCWINPARQALECGSLQPEMKACLLTRKIKLYFGIVFTLSL